MDVNLDLVCPDGTFMPRCIRGSDIAALRVGLARFLAAPAHLASTTTTSGVAPTSSTTTQCAGPAFEPGHSQSGVTPGSGSSQHMSGADLWNKNGVATADSSCQQESPTYSTFMESDSHAARFTVFDKLAGPSIQAKPERWTATDCLNSALEHTMVPLPIARVLLAEVPGWPTPQIVVSSRQLHPHFRAIVLLHWTDTAQPAVVEAKTWETIGALSLETAIAFGFPLLLEAVECEVNGSPLCCDDILPHKADFARIRLQDTNGSPTHSPAGSQAVGVMAVGRAVWAPSLKQALPVEQSSTSSAETDRASEETFPAICLPHLLTSRTFCTVKDLSLLSNLARRKPTAASATSSSQAGTQRNTRQRFSVNDAPAPQDEVLGVRALEGEPQWVLQQYINAALNSARLPERPIARELHFEIISLPSPQIAITQDRGADFRRAMVFDLRDVGADIEVQDVPPGRTLMAAVLSLTTIPSPHLLADSMSAGGAVATVNRNTVDVHTALPTNGDLVHFRFVDSCRRTAAVPYISSPKKL